MRKTNAFDVVGYLSDYQQEFCLRCAPGRYRREAQELHRFEAEGECEQCGLVLAEATETLGATR